MATANPIMLPDGQKDLTRRAVLAGLTLSTAQLALLPHIADHNAKVAEANPHPVLALPFVCDTTPDEQAKGAAPRIFWRVSPTGAYGLDCATGAQYAGLALDYMAITNTPQILQWAVFDMMAAGRAPSGIEIGFLSVFGRIAAHAGVASKGGAA